MPTRQDEFDKTWLPLIGNAGNAYAKARVDHVSHSIKGGSASEWIEDLVALIDLDQLPQLFTTYPLPTATYTLKAYASSPPS